MPSLCKLLTIATMLQCCPQLPAHEQGEATQLWQKYAELGLFDKLLTELETESRKEDSTREPELTHALLTHWEAIMKQRRWCDIYIHWDGEGAYGSISYRTKDMPPEMVQKLHAFYHRYKREKADEEVRKLYIALMTRRDAYIDNAPDAEKIDLLIRHIHAEEYPQAIKQLAQLRREHPDYCPQAFAELAVALDTPKRLNLLLLCTKLPLGVIRETHYVK